MSAEDDKKWARDYITKRPFTPGGIQRERDDNRDYYLPPAPKIPTRKERRRQRELQEYEEAAERSKQQWEQGRRSEVVHQPPAPTPFKATAIDWIMAAIVWVICWAAMRPSTGAGSAAALAAIPSLIALRFWRPVLTFSVVGFIIWLFVHYK